MNIKLWIDDIRPAPDGWIWCVSTNEAKLVINNFETLKRLQYHDNLPEIELISIDHDAGDMHPYGGDYIKVLDFMEENGYNYPIHIHTMNSVGAENMRRIIIRNGWTEVF